MHTATDEQERIAQFWEPLQMHCGDTVMESDPYFDTMLLDDYHIHISLYSTNLKSTGNAVMIVSQNIVIKVHLVLILTKNCLLIQEGCY